MYSTYDMTSSRGHDSTKSPEFVNSKPPRSFSQGVLIHNQLKKQSISKVNMRKIDFSTDKLGFPNVNSNVKSFMNNEWINNRKKILPVFPNVNRTMIDDLLEIKTEIEEPIRDKEKFEATVFIPTIFKKLHDFEEEKKINPNARRPDFTSAEQEYLKTISTMDQEELKLLIDNLPARISQELAQLIQIVPQPPILPIPPAPPILPKPPSITFALLDDEKAFEQMYPKLTKADINNMFMESYNYDEVLTSKRFKTLLSILRAYKTPKSFTMTDLSNNLIQIFTFIQNKKQKTKVETDYTLKGVISQDKTKSTLVYKDNTFQKLIQVQSVFNALSGSNLYLKPVPHFS